MAEPSFAQQIATLNSTLRGIEVRLALGRPPVEGFEEFKSVLDDMRHRLWDLLSLTDDEERTLQERFRIRRATELCRGLVGDLRSGAVTGRHSDLSGLQESVVELGQSIERARTRSS
jgi:hypothetical protein